VTPSRLPRLRRNAGVTAQQLGSHAGVTAQPNGCNTVSAGAVETGDRIANETADSLRSAVLFGACGALIASLGDLSQVVLADINRSAAAAPGAPVPGALLFARPVLPCASPLSKGSCTQIRSQGVNARLAGRAAQQSVTLRAPWDLRRPSGLTRVGRRQGIALTQAADACSFARRGSGVLAAGSGACGPPGGRVQNATATDHRSFCSVRS
jgi:hypothetical protein